MVTSVKRLTAALVVVALSLVAPAAALADGDPAADVLAQQTVFYGGALDLRSKQAAQLPALLEQANAEGYELRVAALSVQTDLGAVDYLWEDPLNYVDLLANELSYIYKGRTLVLMPSGYAIYRVGHSSVRDQRVLDELAPPGGDPTKVLPRALRAVVALAAARGIELTVPDVEPPPGGVTQPTSHFAQRNASMAASAPGRPGAGTVAGGDGNPWLYALPPLALVAAACAVIVRRRLQERSTRRA